MKRAKTQEEKYRQMTEMPVSKLIPGLAVPTIISMLISSVYNMADTFFVSQLGTSASGAVGVIFSAMAIIQAIGFGFGQGAGIFISQSLGNRNTEKAGEAAAASFFAVMIIGVFIGVVGNIFLNPLVMLLGATPTIAPYAEDYAMYILIASPFMMSSFVMNNILRAQGNAVYAMVGITVGGVLNMVLDPLFIFTFGMGTAGAAVATGLSQFISFCILLAQCNLQADCISIRLKNFKPSLKMYGTIFHAGLPSFCRQSIASLGTITLNFAAGSYGEVLLACLHALLLVGACYRMLESGGVGGVSGDGNVYALFPHDGNALTNVVGAVAVYLCSRAVGVSLAEYFLQLAGVVVILGLHIGEAVDSCDDLSGIFSKAV